MWAGFRVAGWVLVVSLLLTACQALDYEDQAPAYRIPAGTVLELHRDLVVPPGQAGVNIQGTAIGDRYRYDAVCRLEVLTVDDAPRPVRADRFTVERVGREWEIFSSRVSGLRYVALFERDGPHLLLFTTFLYLRSERQPDVFRLACGHLQNSDQNPRHLTVAEIRATLAPVMTLQ
ncbi:MAG: hypothetical protein R3F44_19470 [Candidatus Competibacteraceae bacterium]